MASIVSCGPGSYAGKVGAYVHSQLCEYHTVAQTGHAVQVVPVNTTDINFCLSKVLFMNSRMQLFHGIR